MPQSSYALYILTDSNLELPYRAVQGGHAVAQWLLENPGQAWNNETLIYVESPTIMEAHMYKLDRSGIEYTTFREPDLDNRVTAIAAYTDDKFFKNFKLMGS